MVFTICLIVFSTLDIAAAVSSNPDDIAFYLFPDEIDYNDCDVLPYLNISGIKATRYVPSNRLIMYASGFLQNYKTDQAIKNAYLRAGYNKTSNIIIVDWGLLSGNSNSTFRTGGVDGINLDLFRQYLQVIQNVNIVGQRIQEFITWLYNNNLLLDGPQNVHLIGQSLGAHAMGMAGMRFQRISNRRIGRITGTDPAGPIFQMYKPENRLDPTDGNFVDILHTNQGGAGYVGALGHADVYINSDAIIQIQPECKSNLMEVFCSHNMAVAYFAKSVLDTSIKATSCKGNWMHRNICKLLGRNNEVIFGEKIPHNARGSYYVNNLSPYY